MATNLSKTFQVFEVKKNKLFRLLESITIDFPESLTVNLEDQFPKIKIRILYTGYENDKQAKRAFRKAVASTKRRLGNHILIQGHKSLAEILLDKMEERNLTLAVAESCTGGLIGKLITDVPGSSNVFLGSLVTYSDSSKVSLLGVSKEDIKRHTAVSKPVAATMAKGAREKFRADYSISTTGVAGPSGGTPENPVGAVYIGVASLEQVRVKRFIFPGDRKQVRFLAAVSAMELVRRSLDKRPLNVKF